MRAMSVRPPRQFQRTAPKDPLSAALDHELRAEAATTHGRLLKKLERALERLAAADAETDRRARLVAEAGTALWYLMIQRDLMGFRNRAQFLKEMKVPPEVILRMGVITRGP